MCITYDQHAFTPPLRGVVLNEDVGGARRTHAEEEEEEEEVARHAWARGEPKLPL